MRHKSGLEVIVKLIALVKGMRFTMLVAIILGILGNLASIFLTILSGEVLVDILHKQSTHITMWITLILIFAFARGFLRYGEQACNHFIAFTLLAMIRDRVFSQLRKLAPAKLYGKEKGNLIAMLTSDVELLEVFYAHTISPVMIALIVSLVLLFYLAQFHWWLVLWAAFAYLSVGFILPMFIAKLAKQSGANYRHQVAQLNTYVLESIHGLTIVDQYNQGKQHLHKMDSMNNTLNNLNKKLKKVEGITSALSEIGILFFSLMMFLLAAYLYTQKEIPFDAVLLSTIAMMSSFGPVNALSALANNLAITFASGERVLSLLEEEAKIEEVEIGEEGAFASMDMNDVSFSYDEELILKDIHLSFESDKIYGIKGKSGSGKSTLLKLMMRFYDVKQGCIQMNQENIKQWKTSALRENESYVTQETYLFDDSIRHNIKLANLNASEEEIIQACKQANIHAFIMTLQDGYDTKIGALSNPLSGGERQRIGLARAFLHDAKLLLLDEPTSNLDSLNEAMIMKSIKDNAASKSVVIVSHRDSSLQICDEIIPMAEGRNS